MAKNRSLQVQPPVTLAPQVNDLKRAFGIDNLLYSADADFSCFADLALTSPSDYYKPGQGSLMQLVLTPADPYMAMDDETIAKKVDEQVGRPTPRPSRLGNRTEGNASPDPFLSPARLLSKHRRMSWEPGTCARDAPLPELKAPEVLETSTYRN